MRLTLRTLLAYLDDTLEPAQAKLIGQKVAESDAAQELIARIKQVTRRRRLTTPPQSGPGSKLDPNTIAEYLDNVLPGDQIAEVEETSLASDVHLAEVAACHQILTLVLGEPALVPPTARQRMYGLVRGREAIAGRKASTKPIGQGASDGAGYPADEADEALLLGLPRSRLRWVPLAAACLLIAGVAIVMALLPRPQPDRTEQEKQVAKAGPNPPQEQAADSKAKTESQTQPGPKPEPKTKPTVTPAPETKNKETEKKPAVSTPPESPANRSLIAPSKQRREVAKAFWTQEQPSVLVQRVGDEGLWQRVAWQQRVSATDSLVSLPGYRTELRLDSGVYLSLWGNLPEFSRFPGLESAVALYANPAFDLDFRLDHGRVVLSNHKKEEGPARVRVRFDREVWDLTLLDKTSEVALDLVGVCLPYRSKEAEPLREARVYGLKGQALLDIHSKQHALTSPCVFDWDNQIGPAPQPEGKPQPPDWWTNKLPSKSSAATAMQNALDGLSMRLLNKTALDVVLAETLKDSKPENRSLALRCLGAIQDLPHLVDALADDRNWRTRLEAIAELRHLLGLSADIDQKLLNVLRQKNYVENQPLIIVELLHGFSDQQWANPSFSGLVVDYLAQNKLAIRQLAHLILLSRLRPGEKPPPYDPAASPEQRERGFEEWKKLIAGEKPAAKPPPGKK